MPNNILYFTNEWQPLPTDISSLPLATALSIIDDATCFGFEFMVHSGTVFYREIDD